MATNKGPEWEYKHNTIPFPQGGKVGTLRFTKTHVRRLGVGPPNNRKAVRPAIRLVRLERVTTITVIRTLRLLLPVSVPMQPA